MIATLSSNHADLADWLLLIAFVVFVIDVVLGWVGTSTGKLKLVSVGLALLTLALFVT